MTGRGKNNPTGAGNKKGKGVISRGLGVLMAAAVAIGTFGAGVGMWLKNDTRTVYADETQNTVPTGEYDNTNNITTYIGHNAGRTNVYGPSYGSYDIPGVVQSKSSTSATTFAAGLSLGTIYIDQSKINGGLGKFEVVSKDPAIIAGLKQEYTAKSIYPGKTVGYDTTAEGAYSIEAGKVNYLNGDLFTITFKEAAILPNGERRDLQITYSNARIVIDQRYLAAPAGSQKLNGAVYLATGNEFSYGSSDTTKFSSQSYSTSAQSLVRDTVNNNFQGIDNPGFSNSNPTYPAVGMSMDATYRVVNDNDRPEPGTFVFAISGINLDRDPDAGVQNNVAKPLWYANSFTEGGVDVGKEFSFFSEAMSINSGKVSDNVYVRPNTSLEDNPAKITGQRGQYFYPSVSKTNDGKIKFISNRWLGTGGNPRYEGHDDSYNAGFVTLADAEEGFVVTGTGHGHYGDVMNSAVFNSKQIWYRYTSSTDKHGSINTTSDGNYNGELNDGGDILGPTNSWALSDLSDPRNYNRSTAVVAEGKSVTYTMTPDIGYKLSKVYVATAFNNEGVPTSYQEIKFNTTEAVSKMKKGDSVTIDTHDASQWSGSDPTKGEGTLTYNQDGTYTFIFNHATDHEGIHVEWEATTADVLAYKIWKDDDDQDGIRLDAYTNNTNPKYALAVSSNFGKTWTLVTQNAVGDAVSPQNVPSGYDSTTGKYLDGVYSIDNSSTAVSHQNPFTWEYLPIYSYDSNGIAGNALMYKIIEYKDPWDDAYLKNDPNPSWHREYEQAEYFDEQSFVLTSETTNTLNGWLIYEQENTQNRYVHKGDVSDEGTYYSVDDKGNISASPASPQPDPATLHEISTSDYWTKDKAVAYHEVQAKNKHFTTDLDIEVIKKWNDAELLGENAPDGNAYARDDIKIVIHGITKDENDVETIVDLNGDDDGTDLEKTLITTEGKTKNKTIDGYTIYKDETTQSEYALVESDATYTDGYYPVSNGAIDYASGPASSTGTLTIVRNETYKVDDNNFGALFEDLPTHYNGYKIQYSVKETDTSGNELTKWIMTGGVLTPVTAGDQTIGYETTITNTPDIEEIFNKVPLKIVKIDENSGGALEGAEFTIYTDSVGGVLAQESSVKQIGAKTIYSKTEENVTTRYIIQKDSADNQYKYYVLNSDDTIANAPADSQPSKADLTEAGTLGGEAGYTDGTDTYVLRNGVYHLVNNDVVDETPANPQPDSNKIKELKDETTGEVEKSVVTTDENGNADVYFLKTGTYEIKETKAPEGYDSDSNTYRFKVDAELRKITLENPDGEHTLNWWQKVYDLYFGSGTTTATNWQQSPDNKGGTLTVSNTPVKADVLVRKYWNDNDNQDGKRPGDKDNPSSYDDDNLPTVTLQWTTGAHTATGKNVYEDGNGVRYVHNPSDDKYYKVVADGKGSYESDAASPQPTGLTATGETANGAPVYKDASNQKYALVNNEYYAVITVDGYREDSVGSYAASPAATQPTNAVKVSDETCKGLDVYKDSSDQKYVLVGNEYYEVVSLDTIGVIETSPASEQPDANQLNLVMEGGWTTYTYEEGGQTVDATHRVNYVGGPVLTHQNNAYTWNDLPAYRDGKVVTYRVLEEGDILDKTKVDKYAYDIESNHTSQTHEKTFNLIDSSNNTITGLNQTVDVTNKHETQVVNIKVYKTWDDTDESDRSTSTLRLYKVVNGIETIVTTGEGTNVQEDLGTVPVTDETDPVKVWNDLPTYEGGYPVSYLLREDAVDGYITIYEAAYKKTDNTDVDTKTQVIPAEDIKRTFYEQGDTLPTGKKVGDESTTAVFKILNERSVNVKVEKTWINGANANVTYELWRTIKKESELTDSAFTTTAVASSDPNAYYVRNVIILTADEYNALSDGEKANYTKKYVNNTNQNDIITQAEYDALPNTAQQAYTKKYRNDNDNTDIIDEETYNGLDTTAQSDYTAVYVNNSDSSDVITVSAWEALDNPEQAKYSAKYVDDSRTIITKSSYEALSAAEKAKYTIESKTTWSPYDGGGKDGTTTVDGWELVKSYMFDANSFGNSETGSAQHYTFNDLEIKDANGNEYLYRILEKPELLRYRENQISNTQIINNNVNVSDGNVSFEVVKELEGRNWIDRDQFYFFLEPVEGKDVTDPNNQTAVAKADVPMPYSVNPTTGTTTYNYTATENDNVQVGALGKAVTFDSIQYKENETLYQDIPRGSTFEFYYRVYEIYDTKTETDQTNNTKTITKGTTLDTATNHTGIKDGITYDGKVTTGGDFESTVHEAKVTVKNIDGIITTEVQWKKDGAYVTGAVPVYTNKYDAAGRVDGYIVKQVQGREITGADKFNFTVTNIGAAPHRSSENDPGSTEPAEKTLASIDKSSGIKVEKVSNSDNYKPVDGNNGSHREIISDSPTWIKLSDLAQKTADGRATDTFIYEIKEKDDKAGSDASKADKDDLIFDGRNIYLKVVATDNQDGTLDIQTSYHSDASCTNANKFSEQVLVSKEDGSLAPAGADPDAVEKVQNKPVYADASGNRYVYDETDDKYYKLDENNTPATEAEETEPTGVSPVKLYKYTPAALFVNTQTVDISVKKEWVDGPAVEDVTLHLYRKLIPMPAEQNLNYETAESTTGTWEDIGCTYNVKRGDFLKDDGTPKYNQDATTSSQTYGDLLDKDGAALTEEDYIDGFNMNLPKYVTKDGTTYRAVYKLEEDNTSDAYTTTYRSSKSGQDDTAGNQIYIDGETLIVTNTVTAKNSANIAAVKQFLGRNWLTGDDFEFELTPAGKAVYDANGNFTRIDDSDETKSKVPMPEDDSTNHSTTTITGYVNKNDSSDTKTVEQYDEITDADEKANYVAVRKAVTHADKDTTTVDPNGNLERLARFGEISYTTSDLVYDEKDKHMQGDFYYIMKEKLPDIVTTGDDQNYPVEYTVVKADGTTETRTIAEDDRDTMPTAGTGETLKSVKFSNGITYDCDEHKVHVKVRENRTKELQIQIAYDYDDNADISSGTQFTPVYTNRYDAATDVTVDVYKHLMGRDWKTSDKFDFIMTPIGGAPFEDTNPATDTQDSSDFPKTSEDGRTPADIKAALERGKAAHGEAGGHVKRLTVTNTNPSDGRQTLSMPSIRFTYSDLGKTVAAGETVKDKDGTALAEGTAYDRFMYAIVETDAYGAGADDLEIDSDKEYVRITVYDKGDGTLGYYTEFFSDAEAASPRFDPDEDGAPTTTPAKAAPFVNQLKRDLSATKAWAGAATEDVTLKLQWSVNGTNFYDVEGTDWFANIEGNKVIPKGASGKDLTVTWKNLPAYANITDNDDRTGESGDDLDLNDMWLYYQVVEVEPNSAEVYYNKVAYEQGDTKDTTIDTTSGTENKYTKSFIHTEDEYESTNPDTYYDSDDRIDQLYVTNFPKEIEKKATFGVVKQYIGANWTDESFTFKATPVKSKLGSDSDYVDQGATRKIVNYVHNETGAVITAKEYNKITDDTEKAKYTKEERSVTNNMPALASGKDTATADSSTTTVSVNEHAANFTDAITIKRSDLAYNSDTGKVDGEFIYKITEVIPSNAAAVPGDTDYKLGTDDKGNNIKYTTAEHTVKLYAEDNGEEIVITVSYDDRESGTFVPVYTNYALTDTPIEGTKTWVGGPAAEHKNGTVTLDEDDKSIVVSSEDDLKLSLKRKLAKEGATEETLTKDDAGRTLVIVWAKITKKNKDVYIQTGDDTVNASKTYYEYNAATDVYTAVTPDDDDNPSEEGWFEKTTVTYNEYEKQEGGDGNGPYTYTVMAVSGGTYTDPYFYATDNEGYEYNYYIDETQVPTDYSASVNGLDITNVNVKSGSVVVTKEWTDGPAVEDVTLRIQRYLIPVAEIGNYNYAKLEEIADSDWVNIGKVYNASRGDFASTSSKDYIEIEGFNKDLEKYVTQNGVDYQAVYRLVEDNTSDAYDTTYRTENGTGDDRVKSTKGAYYLNTGDKLIVTNTVKATNEANIASVKQLTGRSWKDSDDFEFTLEPAGRGIYNEDGTFSKIDTSDAAKAKVPMPENDADRESTTTGAGSKDAKAATHAKDGMTTVDPNGGMERLARFGAIKYSVNDLEYDPADKHLQGDFYYVMKEVVPGDAINADSVRYDAATDAQRKAGGFKKDGITYDGSEHTVHVKVRENRTGKLQVQIAYDYADPGDISTGTQFTPVYTNAYFGVFDLALRKVWIDTDADGTVIVQRPDSVVLKLTAEATVKTKELTDAGFTLDSAKSTDTKKVYVKNVTLTQAEDLTTQSDKIWQKILTALPAQDGANKEIKYSASEDKLPNYAEPQYIAQGSLHTIVNTYQSTTFTGNKEWVDGELPHNYPTEAQLTLHYQRVDKKGNVVGDGTFDDATVIWSTENEHRFTITGLPEKDKDGNTYVYWVTEEEVPDYKTSYVNASGQPSATDRIYNNGTIINKGDTKKDEIKIIYDGNGGTIDGEKIVESTIERGQDEPDQPKDPVREGYTFGGWRREKDSEGNVIYRANWIRDPETPDPGKIKVTYDFGNGKDPETVEITRGESEPKQPEDPEREGFEFGGWLRSEDEDGNVKYTAHWIPKGDAPGEISITYKFGNGTPDKTDTITRGEDEPDQPADPKPDKPGEVFGGWIRTKDAKGNVTYTARYVKPPETKKTITYIDPLADKPVLKSLDADAEGADVYPSDPKHSGLIFTTWKKIQDKNGNTIVVASYDSDCAQPEEKITVTYRDLDGGNETIYQREQIKKGDKEPAAPADPTKDGYTFDGWERTVDASGNITYNAKWIKNEETTYTVTFYDPVARKNVKVVSGIEEHGSADVPEAAEHEGYVFKGWKGPDGKIVSDLSEVSDITGDMVFTAVYEPVDKPDTFTVTYYDKDGSIIKQDTGIEEGGSSVVPAPPLHENYEFKGWRLPDGSVVKELKVDDVTEDMDFYAVYDEVIEETKTLTRTIHYRYYDKDGKEVTGDVVQSVTFTRKKITDGVTGEVTYTDWTPEKQTFPAVKSLVVDGYKADIDEVPALEVGADTEEVEELYVIYDEVETQEPTTPSETETTTTEEPSETTTTTSEEPETSSSEKRAANKETEAPAKGNKARSPETGDHNDTLKWMMIAVAAAAVGATAAITSVPRRRKGRR